MIRVGLTGGIGAGKSTVAHMLAAHGASVVASDDLAREVLAPGSPGLVEVVERFGPQVLHGDGTLDRASLAQIVFADDQARRDLEAITHPRIRDLTRAHLVQAEASGAAVWVLEIPLLVESNRRDDFDVVVVVEASEDVRMARLTARGLTEEQARARMAHQASDAQRRAAADVVLENNGDEAVLRSQVGALWSELTRRAGDQA